MENFNENKDFKKVSDELISQCDDIPYGNALKEVLAKNIVSDATLLFTWKNDDGKIYNAKHRLFKIVKLSELIDANVKKGESKELDGVKIDSFGAARAFATFCDKNRELIASV